MNELNKLATIQVGTHIYSKLYGGRHGVVFKVHGESNPYGIRQIGPGFMAMGGGADYDVVFNNGTVSHKIPECIIRGVQWVIYDEEPLATAEQISRALAHAELVDAQKKAEALSAKERFEAERLRLIDENRHGLEVMNGYAPASKVAANIRKVLKNTYGKQVKFSVKSSSHGSVGVSWIDGPTSSEVDKLLSPFKAGSFNGMEDMYEYHKNPFVEAFGGVEYLSTSRTNSDEAVQRQIDRLWEVMPSLATIAKPDVQSIYQSWERIPDMDDRIAEVVRTLAYRFNCLTSCYVVDHHDFYVSLARGE